MLRELGNILPGELCPTKSSHLWQRIAGCWDYLVRLDCGNVMDSRSGLIFGALVSWLSNSLGFIRTMLACLHRCLLLPAFLYSLLLGLWPTVCGSRDDLLENLVFTWSHNLLWLRKVFLPDCEVRVCMIPVIILDHNQCIDMWVLISGASCTWQIRMYTSADWSGVE